MTDNTYTQAIAAEVATCTDLSVREVLALHANQLYRALLEQVTKNNNLDDNFIQELVSAIFARYNERIQRAAFYLSLLDLNRQRIWV